MLADKAGNESAMRAEHFARLRAEREIKVAKETKATVDKIEEGFEEGESGGDDAAAAKAKRIADQRNKVNAKVKKLEEDFDAKTRQEKLDLELQRHLEDLERLEINETEKQDLKLRLEELYVKKGQELKAAIDAEQAEKDAAKREEDARLAQELHDKKVSMQLEFFDNAARIAGEETKIGKALLAFKTMIAAKELFLEIKTTIGKAKETAKRTAMIGAEGGAEIAKGSAKAGATLNPFVIGAWAVTAITLAATLAKAVGKAKSISSSFGGSTGGGAPVATAPTTLPQQDTSPEFNVIGRSDTGESRIEAAINKVNSRPIKTYVVSSELTSQQSLDRRSEDSASL